MRFFALILLALLVLRCAGDPQPAAGRPAAGQGSPFAGVQARGATAMGVDQYTSHHLFRPLADGGRIELQRDVDDSAGMAQIRLHMHEIAARFAAGDFGLPGFVHARAVPGTAVMTARRGVITYDVESLPRGAALRVRSGDAAAIRAIHEFLAFQRQGHHAGLSSDS